MSSFIPMVSSSPPPMDEGGGFDWDEEDDDFGGFASADTSSSFKTVENHTPADWNQSYDKTQKEANDDFADFSAFENDNRFPESIPQVENTITHSDNRPESISISKDPVCTNHSNSEIKQSNKVHDSNKDAVTDSNNGPLTDSGMFSSEVSPVPKTDDQAKVSAICEHSDSLDDVLTDSLSDNNVDINLNSELESNCDKVLIQDKTDDFSANLRNNDGNNGTDIPVIANQDETEYVENDSSFENLSPDNGDDSVMCSKDKTQAKVSEDKINIPVTKTKHSINDIAAGDSGDLGNICKPEKLNDCISSDNSHQENHLTNELGEKPEPIDDIHSFDFVSKDEVAGLVQSSNETTTNSGDLSAQDSHIPQTNDCDEDVRKDTDDLNCVETFIKDKVLPEAIKRLSDIANEEQLSDNSAPHISDSDISHNSRSQTYQDLEHPVDKADVKPSEIADDQQQSETDVIDSAHSFDSESNTLVNNEGELNSFVVQDQNEEYKSDGVSSMSTANVTGNKSGAPAENINIPQLSSQKCTPELLGEEIEVSNVHSRDDELSSLGLEKVVTKGETDCTNKDENNDSEDEFGDFNAIQTKLEQEPVNSSGVKDSLSDTAGVNDNSEDEFGDFNAVQTKLEQEPVNSSGVKDSLSDTAGVNDNSEDEFGNFNAVQTKLEQEPVNSSGVKDSLSNTAGVNDNSEDEFGDFNAKSDITVGKYRNDISRDIVNDGFGDFNKGQTKSHITNKGSDITSTEPASEPENIDDFGDFGAFNAGNNDSSTIESGSKDDGFANFSLSNSTEPANNDWAAFNEQQTSFTADTPDEEEDWGEFGDESSTSDRQEVKLAETQQMPTVSLQNMSKNEKLVYAVSSCFPDKVKVDSKFNMPVDDLTSIDEQDRKPNSSLWVQIKSLQTSKEVSYHWTKSEWNSQLFTTLHIDTRNVLIGHKKATVPIFATGLTMLEPVKGRVEAVLKPDVLVDTMKTDTSHSNSQETIPPAQFDWTTSGLTNPLEANNKTLNLDFLIQDQSTKSNELESEFLGPDLSHVSKPAIQPLENILANLKTSSTFQPTNQVDNISEEAQNIVQSLPNLSFMKSRVLMFPLHME